ncbi:MAG: hypothetical protein PVG39_20275 [Desulfobacteraceae bacterium]|jgi:hypothetical protein
MKRHANPKPDKKDLSHFKQVVKEAFPQYSINICSHGDLGGHRAPRDHTIAFRLIDAHGKFRSNVVWVMPQSLKYWTVDDVKKAVKRSNGK